MKGLGEVGHRLNRKDPGFRYFGVLILNVPFC